MKRRFQVIRGGQAAGPERAGAEQRVIRPQFEQALIAHLDSLFAFAVRLVGGQRERAEDLVQETCLRAFRNYDSVRSPEKIKSWLFTILIHTYINDYHRRSHEPPIVDVELSDALLESAQVGPVATPEDHLFEQLLDADVREALDALPVEFRAVVAQRRGRTELQRNRRDHQLPSGNGCLAAVSRAQSAAGASPRVCPAARISSPQ